MRRICGENISISIYIYIYTNKTKHAIKLMASACVSAPGAYLRLLIAVTISSRWTSVSHQKMDTW